MSVTDALLKFSKVTLSKTLERDVANMEMTKELLLQRAESVVSVAKSIAPYAQNDAAPHYRDEIVAILATDNKTKETVGRANANNFKSVWIEFGTVKMPAQHVLTRACESALGQNVQAARHAQGL